MITRKSTFWMFSVLFIVVFLLTDVLSAQAKSLVSPLYISGDFVWGKSMGGSGHDSGFSIAVDSSGNVYTTGNFSGTADFDPGTGTSNLTSAGGYDIFVSKLDSSGHFVWAKNMGGTSDDDGNSITVDSSGNIYTTGIFQGVADFDPGASIVNLTSVGLFDIFVSKLDSNGDFVWAKNMGGTSNDDGHRIAVDSSGNVYTMGTFSGTADFDPDAGTSNLVSAGLSDIFVSKLNSNGDFVWAKKVGGTNYDSGISLALDSSGKIYITGYFQGTVDFDPGVGTTNLTSAGAQDIFVSKLDSSGNLVWAKKIGGANYDSGFSIAVDSTSNVYTTGSFAGTVDFDPGAGTANLTSAGGDDIFVSKLDSNGDFVWAKKMGGTDYEVGYGITLDSSGNVYATGSFEGAVDFDPGAGMTNLTSSGSWDIFVSKLDGSGNFVWAKSMGGTGYDSGNSIAIDASKNIYTTGSFEGTADFDPGAGTVNLTSAGAYNIFVSKLEHDAVGPCSPAIVVANNQNVGAGSLRQGISDICSEGTITFDPSLSGGTIYLASSLIIDKSLTINGSSLASYIQISGDTDNNGTGDVSVFQIGGPATVELNGLDIVKGKSSGTSGGGGVENYATLTIRDSTVSGNSYFGGIGGGGIYNKGELTIIDSTVAGNSAKDGGDGGGIFNEYDHTLSITGSTFSNNTGALFGDGYQGAGGGIANLGTLLVDESTFLDNDGYGGGGAIFNGINGFSTIKNSSFTNNTVFGYGLGGAIYNHEGSMIIENCTFTNNSQIGVGKYGGAVYNEDQMSITDSIFTGNSGSYGGGIANLGTLTIANSTLSDNSADYGGGVANYEILTMTNSMVSGNSADIGFGAGGGILNDDDGILIVLNSTISNNSSSNGGGIFNLSALNGTVTISNSTISGNTVPGNGGGISNFAILNMTNNTFFGNSAAYGGGIFSLGTLTVQNSTLSGNSAITNGGSIANFGAFNLSNTIIANSTNGEDCYSYNGAISTNTSNLVENNAASPNQCGTPSLTADPNLGPLADNGGLTMTMALAIDSPALNAGNDDTCELTDQRGITRPQGPHCDIGSYEYKYTPPQAPVLRSPRTNTITNDPTPTFWWTKVKGGVTYEIEVANIITFIPIIDSDVVSGLSHTVALPLSDNDYFWRVRAINASNQPGAWSSTRTFTIDTTGPSAPALGSPANNFSSNRTPTFKWLSVPTAVLYEFQYDNDSDLSSPTYTVTVRGTFRKPPAMKLGIYYWHVRAKDASGNWGDWSAPNMITITSP